MIYFIYIVIHFVYLLAFPVLAVPTFWFLFVPCC